jgi:RNA polymerase sigma-70 factor (ECF subfamily)
MAENIHDSDHKNTDLFQKGDKEAARVLFKSAYETVRRFAYRLVEEDKIRAADADDIIAETMRRCFEKSSTYNGTSKFSVWAAGIAKNVVMEHLRKSKTDELLGDERLDMVIFGRDPLAIVLEKEKRQILEKAKKNLSNEHRDVIQLRFYNQCSIKQVASFLEKSEDAAESLCRRALNALKKELEKNHY